MVEERGAPHGRELGVIGLGVMGLNLALNVSDHGFPVAVWNLEPEVTERAVAAHPALKGCVDLPALVASLARPRRILLMITAGKPVDLVLAQLAPLLDPGDVVIDGGNSWYLDTARREAELKPRGLHFFGMGVSGGEAGARRGPSLMPGGEHEGWLRVKPVLEAIAAKTDTGPCVAYCGPQGAGHFVKMVHNGIEYADMQLIAEAYDLLRRAGGLDAPALAEVFARWNEGPLASFLVEITGQIFRVRDPETGDALVDRVLDKAGQKGTGRWTVQVALDLGVAVPVIAAALDARVLSSLKDARVSASRRLVGPPALPAPARDTLVADVHDALLAAKIIAYSQGLGLIAAASQAYGWGTPLAEMARIWTGGCIIRARLLKPIMEAFAADPNLASLVLAPEMAATLHRTQAALRRVAQEAVGRGIPTPALSASLAWWDSYRAADLPQNLTQAQRDAFGAHTYQRRDDPTGPFVHTRWLPES